MDIFWIFQGYIFIFFLIMRLLVRGFFRLLLGEFVARGFGCVRV
jgi:hypothetical protein